MEINEEKLAEKSYSSFLESDGIHEVPPEQQEGMDDELEQIGEHEEKITAKLDRTDLDKISPETKKNLSLLGRFKSIFAGKTMEQKYEEKRDFIASHGTKRHVYFDLKGGQDKPDNELSKKYVEIASEGIPKLIKNEAGIVTDVVDATRYENIG